MIGLKAQKNNTDWFKHDQQQTCDDKKKKQTSKKIASTERMKKNWIMITCTWMRYVDENEGYIYKF